MTIPRCPKCGEPARFAHLSKTTVRCVLNDDGTPGKVVSVAKAKDATITSYECGAPHVWSPVETKGTA